jgi:hypothetical protein
VKDSPRFADAPARVTAGRVYYVSHVDELDQGFLWVFNDKGEPGRYHRDRFVAEDGAVLAVEENP